MWPWLSRETPHGRQKVEFQSTMFNEYRYNSKNPRIFSASQLMRDLPSSTLDLKIFATQTVHCAISFSLCLQQQHSY